MRPKGAGRKNLAPKNRETGDRETGGAKPKTGGPIVLQIIIVCTTNYLKLFYLIKLFYCCSANTRANRADEVRLHLKICLSLTASMQLFLRFA